MIALIYDTRARLPAILEFCVDSSASCLWSGGGGHGDKETQGKVAEEARQSAQTGREIVCRCVQCTIDSCALPVIDSVRLGGSVAGLTLSMRRAGPPKHANTHR